jgi:hypothetical protein
MRRTVAVCRENRKTREFFFVLEKLEEMSRVLDRNTVREQEGKAFAVEGDLCKGNGISI